MGFKVMNFDKVVHAEILKFLDLQDVLNLSTCSQKSRQLITDARVQPKRLNIRTDQIEIRLANNLLYTWKFVESLVRLANYEFENIWRNAKSIGNNVWKTECSDSRLAMAVVLRKMDSLFRILQISELSVQIKKEDNLPEDVVLKGTEKCLSLDLELKAPVKDEHFEWLMKKMEGDDGEVKILNTCEAQFNYKKTIPAAKLIILQEIDDWILSAISENCTHVHFTKTITSSAGSSSKAELGNKMFRLWQSGSFPSLKIFEVSHCGSGDLAEELLFDGIETEPWDIMREDTLNMNLFYYYADLKFMKSHLKFRESKTFTRSTDGLKATVVPRYEIGPPTFNSFVFIVWSNWIPEKFRRPSKLPYPYHSN